MKNILGIYLAISLLCVDLIIAGIIGLRTKRIKAHNLAVKIILFPLGLIGSVASRFYKHKPEEGAAAVTASIASITAGSFVILTLTIFYLIEQSIMSNELANIIIPPILWAAIIFLIIVIFRAAMKK